MPAFQKTQRTRRLIEDADHSDDQQAAEKLKEQIRKAPGPDKTWPRITTVLGAFREQALIPEVAERIDAALTSAGITAEPKLTELDSRSGTVCLSLAGANSHSGGSPIHAVAIDAAGWCDLDGNVPRKSDVSILWIDVDVMAGDHQALSRALKSACADVSDEIVTDLYLMDAIPKVYAYDREAARAVSAAAIDAQEADRSDARSGHTGKLSIRLVELVAGDGWLITCWHRERILRGAREDVATGGVPASMRVGIRKHVERRWQELREPSGEPTAGDLGLLFLEEVTSTYEQARIELSAWLDAWELEFYARSMEPEPDPDKIDQVTLVNLRSLAAEFKRCVTPLDVPRRKARASWFDQVTNETMAEQIDEGIDGTLKGLDHLGDRIRGNFDLVHLQLSQAHERIPRSFRIASRRSLLLSLFRP